MRKFLFPLCALMLFPILASADSNGGVPSAGEYEISSTEIADGSGSGRYSRYNQNWDKNPQARDAYLTGEENYQKYHDQNRGTSGRNYDVAADDQSHAPKNNPKWYRSSEARKAYLRGDKDYRQYSTPNRPVASRSNN